VRTSPAGSLLAALAALSVALVPSAAAGHGVAAEVDQREGAVAVRVRYHGDRPLAGARFEVRSPRGAGAPFAEGRTDRHGWLAFTPDVAGKWQVRVVDAGGHGKVVDVEVADATVAARSAASPAGAAGSPLTIDLAPEGGAAAGREAAADATTATGGGGTGGYALRVVAGVTAIVVVFRLLLAVQRARRARGG
jgi:nickel transport protein